MSKETAAIVVTAAQSPGNTPDGRIILQLEADGLYECSLTRAGALDVVRSVLWALGNLPTSVDQDEPKAMGIQVFGSAEIGVGMHSRTPNLLASMNGLGVAIELSIPALRQLQREMDATLIQITAEAEQGTVH